MPDYEKLYFKMFRACEQAIGILIEAQKECEELYLYDTVPRIVELPRTEEQQR